MITDVLGFTVRWIKASKRLLLSMRRCLSRKLYGPAFSNIRYEKDGYSHCCCTLIIPKYLPSLSPISSPMMIFGLSRIWCQCLFVTELMMKIGDFTVNMMILGDFFL